MFVLWLVCPEITNQSCARAGLSEIGSELWDPRTGARSGMKRSPRTSTNRDAIFTESRDHRGSACLLCPLAAVGLRGADVSGISAMVNELRDELTFFGGTSFKWRSLTTLRVCTPVNLQSISNLTFHDLHIIRRRNPPSARDMKNLIHLK